VRARLLAGIDAWLQTPDPTNPAADAAGPH